MQARGQVAGTDEAAEKAGAINVAVEDFDAATPKGRPRRPVGARCIIEMGSDERVEDPAVGRNLLAAVEARDVGMGGQVAEGCKRQAVGGDMMRVVSAADA